MIPRVSRPAKNVRNKSVIFDRRYAPLSVIICEHALTNARVSVGSNLLAPITESSKTTCLSPSNTTPRAREPFSSFCPGRFKDKVGSLSGRLLDVMDAAEERDLVLK